MSKILFVGLLCIASSLANFELPMVIDIGGFNPNTPRIDNLVQAAGPFVHPRNITFNFVWDTADFGVVGVRLRGTEPRYDLVAVTINRLDRSGFSIDVTVQNTSFVLFWAEPHGYENLVPMKELKSPSTL